MRIGIDVNEILHGQRAIRRYTLALVRALLQIQSPHDYRLLYFRFRKPAGALPEMSGARSAYKKNPVFFPGRWLVRSWRKFHFPDPSWLMGRLDLFHSTGTFVPPRGKAPSVVTIHSTAYLHSGDFLDPAYKSWYESLMKWCLENADYFITVSETMRLDFLEAFPVAPERVRAIPLGVGTEFYPRARAAVRARLKTRFGLAAPYFLYVGGIQPHKNVQAVVKAFVSLKKRRRGDLRLVLAGDQPARSGEILELIEKSGFKDQILLTGYLSQESEDLAVLYAGAEVFLFPSFWEGWASPPLEAMASGVPVIASDIPPFHESLGKAACFVDANNAEQIGAVAERFLEDRNLSEEYRKIGLRRVRDYTWERTARSTLKFYEEIHAKNSRR